MTVSITAAMPVYNGEKYLREALDSALAQTRPAQEILVVDDGSTDRTAEILASYGAAVRVIRTPNRGLSAARNEGLREARGTHVAFLDADDRWLPGKLEAFAARAASHPAAGVFFSDALSISEDGRPRRALRCPRLPGAFFERMLENNWMVSSAVMMSREVPARAGWYRDDFLHKAGVVDWEFFLRAARRWTVVHIPEVLTEYRVSGSGAMHTSLEKLRADGLKVVELFAADVPPAVARTARAAVHHQSAVRFLAALDGAAARRDLACNLAEGRNLFPSFFLWLASWGGKRFLAAALEARRRLMRADLEFRPDRSLSPDRVYPPPGGAAT